MNKKAILCFGFGFSASYLAKIMKQWEFIGTSRTAKQGRLIFNQTTPLPDTIIQQASHVLFSIPPDENGDLAFRLHHKQIASSPNLKWAGYLSTSGVYGDCKSNWIDETAPPNPISTQAKRRLNAEQQWGNLFANSKINFQIFRLPGIYGPTRSVLEKILNGTARRIRTHNHFNCRIHVEDIAQTLRASILKPNNKAVYNVVDDEPAPNHKVVEYAAKLMGVKPPPFTKVPNLASQRFYLESRRIKNERIKSELGVKLIHPNYMAGLEAIITSKEFLSRAKSSGRENL